MAIAVVPLYLWKEFLLFNMAAIIAFDFGTGHIGVAVGNDVTKTVSPLKALKARDGIPNDLDIKNLLNEWRPQILVVGLPLNMDGTTQPLTFKAKKFGNRLAQNYKLKVVFIDERLTSCEAKDAIFSQGGFRALAKDKGRIDAAAAASILEQYFSEYAHGQE